MFNVYKKEIEFAGKTLTLETGKVARQADGCVLATVGETTVLCAVTGAKSIRPGQDFFPLSVHYQEKTYSAGKIPGGFFKREARPSEKETLTSRLIDRPIRPLFPKGFLNEVQVVTTVISHDLENDPDMIAMIGASAALTISGIPFMGPIAGARVSYQDGEYVVNPPMQDVGEMDLDLVVAGTKEGVLMVESEAQELSEEIMLGAVRAGHEAYQAYGIQDMLERQTAVGAARDAATEAFLDEENGIDANMIKSKFKSLEADVVRGQVLKTGKRIDERDTKTVRSIVSEVGVLPRTHGSALFTRGETQALVVATLGTGQDEQIVDRLEGSTRERFLLHYNFPPYSVGEAGRMGPPGRREIGHGKLAWRALNPMLPTAEEFPYTMRLVSEITESNGSSSMASVCGASLALMDAGAPLKAPVAGIAMGLIKDGDDFAVLSDILGDEDHLGDMDFKVAGTENGITSLQMDIKITSITEEIMTIALDQAKDGRIHILGEMAKALDTARSELNANAPQIVTLTIPTEKIRDVIGTGGKVIRGIIEETETKIDINDDGIIKVAASSQEAIDKAVKMINDITEEPEVGKIYNGKVVKTVDFGAFVNFMGARDGLVHISELQNARTANTTDVVNEGDEIKVLCIGMDDRGKVKLSMKRVDQETGEEIAQEDRKKEANG